MLDLRGRVAIVTGGAQGIGGATARRLAEGGARVLIADVDMEAAAANQARIVDAGGEAEIIHADVAMAADVEAMVGRAVERWGRLDILVNNAWGRHEPDGSVITLTETAFDHAVDVSIKAIFRAVKLAAPHMAVHRVGSIVNISSAHGLLVAPGKLAYEVMKAAVIAITRQMAVDLGPQGIRVNAICPGHIVTERSQRHWDANPSLVPFFEQQYPVRHMGKPDDIAYAVRFLCADEANFITGHALAVDGGLTIQLQEDLGVSLARYYRDHPDVQLPA
ncbi:MAG: SDR family oxidoreductase [Caldilineae bacterium]|nr:MAG: SDR family oxidoreductase [Caldilineae bacterium]